MNRCVRSALLAGAAAAAALSLGACAGVMEDRVHEDVRETVRAGPAPVVHVDNIAGEVRVEGTPGSAVEIAATKYGYDENDLKRTRIGVQVTGEGVFIETTYSGGAHRGGVRYRIGVPVGASVQVSNVAGAVEVSGVSGDVTVETQAGVIVADAGRVAGSRTIDLRATTGAISLSIKEGSSASVEAASTVGAFSSNVPGLTQNREHLVGSKASGLIGSGSATIRLETTTGAISVRERT
jgi:DUF4097 and DUF4098 domain-containing protein YvlB